MKLFSQPIPTKENNQKYNPMHNKRAHSSNCLSGEPLILPQNRLHYGITRRFLFTDMCFKSTVTNEFSCSSTASEPVVVYVVIFFASSCLIWNKNVAETKKC